MARYRQPGLAVILQDSHARFPGIVRSIDQAKRTCDIMFDDNDRDLVVPFACIDPPRPRWGGCCGCVGCGVGRGSRTYDIRGDEPAHGVQVALVLRPEERPHDLLGLGERA